MDGTLRRKAGTENKRIVGYRLGLFDPDPDRNTVVLLADRYSDSTKDRLTMKLAVAKYSKWAATQTNPVLCMAVFPIRDKARDKS